MSPMGSGSVTAVSTGGTGFAGTAITTATLGQPGLFMGQESQSMKGSKSKGVKMSTTATGGTPAWTNSLNVNYLDSGATSTSYTLTDAYDFSS